jgi:DNA polymerase sigma
MSLESDITKIMDLLERKQVTHPKIAVFWKQYISRKIMMLEKSLNDCQRVMDALSSEQSDIEPEALAMAYFFANALRSSSS